MQQNRAVRVVKRDERMRAETNVKDAREDGVENQERKLKTVVSGWIREHKERSEEYQRMFATMLRETGFRPSRAASRA
jgi:predicted component of type VI protein secretion system